MSNMNPGFYKRLGTSEEIHSNVISKEYERQYEELRDKFEKFTDFFDKNVETIDLINKLWEDGAYNGARHYLIDHINAPMSRITDPDYFKEVEDLYSTCIRLVGQRGNMTLLRDYNQTLAYMTDRLHSILQQIKDLCWMKTCLELSFSCCGPID